MIEITAEIRAFIDKAAAGVELAGDEYIDPSDGLIHCKKCGGQRQTVVPCFGKSGYFVPRCICQCQREAEEQRKASEERQRRMEPVHRKAVRVHGFYRQAVSEPCRHHPALGQRGRQESGSALSQPGLQRKGG